MTVCVVSQPDRRRFVQTLQARGATTFCVNTINDLFADLKYKCEQLKNFNNFRSSFFQSMLSLLQLTVAASSSVKCLSYLMFLK